MGKYCCYFGVQFVAIKIQVSLDLNKTLIHEKLSNTNFVYRVAYKRQHVKKKFRISFDVVEECIKKRDIDQYLSLLYSNKKHEEMFDRIQYHISQKCNISDA